MPEGVLNLPNFAFSANFSQKGTSPVWATCRANRSKYGGLLLPFGKKAKDEVVHNGVHVVILCGLRKFRDRIEQSIQGPNDRQDIHPIILNPFHIDLLI